MYSSVEFAIAYCFFLSLYVNDRLRQATAYTVFFLQCILTSYSVFIVDV